MTKYIFTFLLVLLAPLLVIAQQIDVPVAITDKEFDDQDSERTAPVVKVKLLDIDELDVRNLVSRFTVVNLHQPLQSSYEVKASDDGSFIFQLPHALPYQQVFLAINPDIISKPIIVNEGLELQIDLKNPDQNNRITFFGKDAEVNQFMKEYDASYRKTFPEFGSDLLALDKGDPVFFKKLDALFEKVVQFNNHFFEHRNTKYRFLIDEEFNTEYLGAKISFFVENDSTIDNIEPMLTPIYSVTMSTSGYLKSLYRYCNNRLANTKEERLDKALLSKIINKNLPTGFADLVKLQIQSPELKIQYTYYSSIMPYFRNAWAKNHLDIERSQLGVKIAQLDSVLNSSSEQTGSSKIGKFDKSLPFGANLYINQAKTGEELIKNIQNSYPDNLVIVDLWATWCVPCIQNMQFSKVLHENSEKEKLPVVFLYLCSSASSSVDNWKIKLAQMEQPGEHVFVESSVINRLQEIFNLSGFPSYFAITPHGEIDTKSVQNIRDLGVEQLKHMSEL